MHVASCALPPLCTVYVAPTLCHSLLIYLCSRGLCRCGQILYRLLTFVCVSEREMAAAAVVMMIATSLLLIGIGSVNVGEAWEEANVIHVGGKVLCQDCTKGWNEWVNGSNPIKGTDSSLSLLVSCLWLVVVMA